jgi:hypothetical protein
MPPFWQLLLPLHEMSHVSALQLTPVAHDVPCVQTTVQVSPPHVTTPFWQAFEPSHVMLQRSASHFTPDAHAEPCEHVTSQNSPPHSRTAFWHAFEPWQRTLQPAASLQLTPARQAVPPVQVMSHVRPAGHATAVVCVDVITHQPPLLHVPFADAHAVGSHANGPASAGVVSWGAASAGASSSAPSSSPGPPSRCPCRAPCWKLHALRATTRIAARTLRS